MRPHDPTDDAGDDDLPEGPSKSARKRDAHALQDLGEELIAAPQAVLDSLDLPENLKDAIDLARRITSRGGLARQRQYIGKLMRKIDVEPIRAALAAREDNARLAARRFQKVEVWRTRLLAEGEAGLDALSREVPSFDRAALLRLIERARHEALHEQPPAAARKLFAELRALLESARDQ